MKNPSKKARSLAAATSNFVDSLSAKDKKTYFTPIGFTPETLPQRSRRMVVEIGDEIAANIRKSILAQNHVKQI